MNIRVVTFAVLRDALGFGEQIVAVESGTSVLSVWERLRTEHPSLARFSAPPLFAVNESYAAPQTVLQEGDELALIPPVSGG